MTPSLHSRAEAYSAGISQYKEKIEAVRLLSEQIVDLVELLEDPELKDDDRARVIIRLKALCAMLAPARSTRHMDHARTLFPPDGEKIGA